MIDRAHLQPSHSPDRARAWSPARLALLDRRLRGLAEFDGGVRAVSPRPDRLPVSYPQSRLWFLDRLHGSSQYNMTGFVPIRGSLDEGAAVAALRAIVDRHEVLRTRFANHDGEPVQIIEHDMPLSVPLVDLTSLDSNERQRSIEHHLRETRVQPFDLSRGPVIRATLFRLSESEHLLMRTVHHVAWDAWSAAVFDREFHALYDAYRAGRSPSLPPLPVQYADYALWQRQGAGTTASRDAVDYWKAQLAGIPERLQLPVARPRSASIATTGDACQVTLSRSQADALAQLCAATRATPFMALLAVFGVLLSRYSGDDDIVIGVPAANRDDPNIEHLIGFFVNSLPMRVRPNPKRSVCDLLSQVRQTALDAYAHQSIPFERIVEEVAPPRRFDVSPLFQVMFGMLNQAAHAAAESPDDPMSGHARTPVSVHGERPIKFELEVYAWQHGASTGLWWIYNRDLFDRAWIETMAGHFAGLIETMAASLDRAVGQLAMLTAEEQRQLLD